MHIYLPACVVAISSNGVRVVKILLSGDPKLRVSQALKVKFDNVREEERAAVRRWAVLTEYSERISVVEISSESDHLTGSDCHPQASPGTFPAASRRSLHGAPWSGSQSRFRRRGSQTVRRPGGCRGIPWSWVDHGQLTARLVHRRWNSQPDRAREVDDTVVGENSGRAESRNDHL